MASIMWALGLSFVLLCSFHLSLQDLPRIVACLQDRLAVTPMPISFRNSSGEFQLEKPSSYECNSNGLEQLCRNDYGQLFYAVDIIESFKVMVPLIQGNRTTTQAVTMRKFLCKARSSAAKLNVPVGSWSDTLKSAFHVPRRVLIAEAKSQCNGNITDSSFGGERGGNADIHGYDEMTFVCDNDMDPLMESIPDILLSSFDKEKAAHRSKIAMPILDAFAATTAKWKKSIRARGRLAELQKLNATVSKHLAVLTENLNGFSRYSPENINCDLHKSSNALFALARFHVTDMLLDDDMPEDDVSYSDMLKKYNIEEVFHNSNETALFPDIGAEMRSLYLDHCTKHMPGIDAVHLDFMAQPNAHVKLMAMYEEIFTSGRIDRKYLAKENVV